MDLCVVYSVWLLCMYVESTLIYKKKKESLSQYATSKKVSHLTCFQDVYDLSCFKNLFRSCCLSQVSPLLVYE